ncbi:MAG: hypothetical protein RI906_212 [Pseudomonadota bacterium]|jgi:cation transport protein ChaC
MSRVVLTRESILRGDLQASVKALLGPSVRLMSDEERAASIDTMLKTQPMPGSVWVFAFGSLIWNPAFLFAEQRVARIHGFHREFCLWAWAGRGSPQQPGLMLSLERGGSCCGVAYRLEAGAERSELDVLWRREMLTMAYRPVWTRAVTQQGVVPAITFSANRTHERYAPGLSTEQVAHYLATGEGPLGLACDYLYDTATKLRELGICDRSLDALEARVRAARCSTP